MPKGNGISGFEGGSLEQHPRQWLGAQWAGPSTLLGVPSCPSRQLLPEGAQEPRPATPKAGGSADVLLCLRREKWQQSHGRAQVQHHARLAVRCEEGHVPPHCLRVRVGAPLIEQRRQRGARREHLVRGRGRARGRAEDRAGARARGMGRDGATITCDM
jgi:hypothetical protein